MKSSPSGLVRGLLGRSWHLLTLSIVAGLVAGFSSTGLLALTNSALQEGASGPVALTFAGLCLLVLVSGIGADILSLRLEQRSVFELRLWLSHRILRAPYRQLQRVGRHRLLASLTEDIANISKAFEATSYLCIDGAILLGCLVYAAWLSWPLFLAVAAFLLLGVVSFYIPQRKALEWLRRARESGDALFHDFRALTEGAKELKMNRDRRHDFLQNQLRATADRVRHQFNRGWTIYLVAAHWGKLLFYVLLGLLLFALPAIHEVS
ncbi:MAG: ABC transporter transmembrane domain-containing protein, partial [Pyrinomonadaceae bacterium]